MPAPATDTPLFVASDLVELIDEEVTDERAALVESVVWGWLRPLLGLTARPDPVPAEVFSWAIELGAIYAENPKGLTAYQLGEERSQYSAERRAAILTEVTESPGNATGGNSPRGHFPPPPCWPAGFWQ